MVKATIESIGPRQLLTRTGDEYRVGHTGEAEALIGARHACTAIHRVRERRQFESDEDEASSCAGEHQFNVRSPILRQQCQAGPCCKRRAP